jgi:hypothetical protein
MKVSQMHCSRAQHSRPRTGFNNAWCSTVSADHSIAWHTAAQHRAPGSHRNKTLMRYQSALVHQTSGTAATSGSLDLTQKHQRSAQYTGGSTSDVDRINWPLAGSSRAHKRCTAAATMVAMCLLGETLTRLQCAAPLLCVLCGS